jgi:hypothetical protein
MGMFNDLFELLADVPLTLATAWAVWLGAGALLVLWFRRVDYEVEYSAPAPRTVSKPKPVSRSSPSAEMHAGEHGNDTAAERHKPPVVVGDPFGDLATLLDQPAGVTQPEPPPTPPRAPAESPILSSSGSPIRPQINHRLNTDQK